jgi:hypothetical protein
MMALKAENKTPNFQVMAKPVYMLASCRRLASCLKAWRRKAFKLQPASDMLAGCWQSSFDLRAISVDSKARCFRCQRHAGACQQLIYG